MTDFHLKYLKYKQKYLNLKSNLVGSGIFDDIKETAAAITRKIEFSRDAYNIYKKKFIEIYDIITGQTDQLYKDYISISAVSNYFESLLLVDKVFTTEQLNSDVDLILIAKKDKQIQQNSNLLAIFNTLEEKYRLLIPIVYDGNKEIKELLEAEPTGEITKKMFKDGNAYTKYEKLIELIKIYRNPFFKTDTTKCNKITEVLSSIYTINTYMEQPFSYYKFITHVETGFAKLIENLLSI